MTTPLNLEKMSPWQLLVSAEMKHAGTYTFTVSNRVGSVDGCTKLVVCTDDEECTSAPRVESNPDNFGEYVSTFHAHSNSAFFEQFQVIQIQHFYIQFVCYMVSSEHCFSIQALSSGEGGHQTAIGKTSANSALNRFRNTVACESICYKTQP